jgi:hypothetical protein
MLIVTASTLACPCTVEPCTVEQAPLPPINPVTTILPTFQHVVELAEPVDPAALHTLMLPRLTYVTAPPPTYTLQPIPSMNILLLLPVILPRLIFVIAPPVIHSVSVDNRTAAHSNTVTIKMRDCTTICPARLPTPCCPASQSSPSPYARQTVTDRKLGCDCHTSHRSHILQPPPTARRAYI